MELNELFEKFSALVKELSDKVDASNKRMDDILKLYHDEEDRWNDEQDSKHWKECFGEKIAPYAEFLSKSFEDFAEPLEAIRKDYNSKFKDEMSDEEYVEKLIPAIEKKIADVKEAVEKLAGEKVDAVAISSDGEETEIATGDTKEEAEEQLTEDAAIEDAIDEAEAQSESSESSEEAEDEAADEEDAFDQEAFEKELMEYKEKHNL